MCLVENGGFGGGEADSRGGEDYAGGGQGGTGGESAGPQHTTQCSKGEQWMLLCTVIRWGNFLGNVFHFNASLIREIGMFFILMLA